MSLSTIELIGPINGCDTDTAITSQSEAHCLIIDTPYDFIFLDISLGKGESSGDLSKTELNNLTSVGWKVGVVQHAYSEGTVLTASPGSTAQNNAVYNAKSIGVPSGAYLWLDIEDYSSSSNVYGFCEAWPMKFSTDNTSQPYIVVLLQALAKE